MTLLRRNAGGGCGHWNAQFAGYFHESEFVFQETVASIAGLALSTRHALHLFLEARIPGLILVGFDAHRGGGSVNRVGPDLDLFECRFAIANDSRNSTSEFEVLDCVIESLNALGSPELDFG